MPSQAEIEEHQQDVEELSALAVAEVAALIVAAMDDGGDRSSLVKAIVAAIEPYMVAAAELAVDWYRSLARTTGGRGGRSPNPVAVPSMTEIAPMAGPTDRIALLDAAEFEPRPAPMAPREQIESTVWWALSAADTPEPDRPAESDVVTPEQGARLLGPEETTARAQVIPAGATPEQARVISRMAGATQRYVTTAARDTITENADREGVRWARLAKPDACAFCRLLASRGPDYLTEESAQQVVGRRGRPRGPRKIGELYHDWCQCEPIAVRAGDSYEPPEYAADWELQYRKAAATIGNSRDTKAILAEMRRLSIADGGSNR